MGALTSRSPRFSALPRLGLGRGGSMRVRRPPFRRAGRTVGRCESRRILAAPQMAHARRAPRHQIDGDPLEPCHCSTSPARARRTFVECGTKTFQSAMMSAANVSKCDESKCCERRGARPPRLGGRGRRAPWHAEAGAVAVSGGRWYRGTAPRRLGLGGEQGRTAHVMCLLPVIAAPQNNNDGSKGAPEKEYGSAALGNNLEKTSE